VGDFGILVHSDWRRRAVLAYNLASASTVLVGTLAAYLPAGQVQVAVLLAFAAGNFLYIALADLVPELTTSPAPTTRPSTPPVSPPACSCCSCSPCSTETRRFSSSSRS
jgi:zinc transporter ZupT